MECITKVTFSKHVLLYIIENRLKKFLILTNISLKLLYIILTNHSWSILFLKNFYNFLKVKNVYLGQ